jgi:hypothetical protein
VRWVDTLAVATLIAIVCVAAVAASIIGGLLVRRHLLARGGAGAVVSLRIGRRGNFVLGVGRYHGEKLLWYRLFSVASRPRRALTRRGLTILQRRPPTPMEVRNLLTPSIVLECLADEGRIDIAISEDALPGFLAWLESGPSMLTAAKG